MVRDGIIHLMFVAEVYRRQLARGRHFLHEHPWTAKSWNLDSMKELLGDARVMSVQTHMCKFGMESHISSVDGDKGLVKKPTLFMTNSSEVAKKLDRQ